MRVAAIEPSVSRALASALATRVVTGIVLVAVVLAALFALPSLAFAIVLLLIVVMAALEWATLIGLTDAWRAAFAIVTLVAGAALLWLGADRGEAPVVVAVCGVATLFWIAVGVPSVLRNWQPASSWLRAVSALVVLEGAFVAILACRAHSPWLALAAMAIVWIADTAAYFSGRRFGRHKLAPAISPGKTWEGALGALIAVGVYALALVPLAERADYRGVHDASAIAAWLWFALALAALSIVGDLHESLLKRRAGAKDSGAILPGHGGVLDRIDSATATLPLAALLWPLLERFK